MASNCLPKLKKGFESQIKAVGIYRQDIGMEFGIEKCAMIIMRSGKLLMTEGIELPNQEKKNQKKKKTECLKKKKAYKYLGKQRRKRKKKEYRR